MLPYSVAMCKSENWKPMSQHCLLIHYCTEKITLLLLQLDLINTTIQSAKTLFWVLNDCTKALRVAQLFFIVLFLFLETRWRWRLDEDIWISNGRRLQFVLVSFSVVTTETVTFPLKIQFCYNLALFWMMLFIFVPEEFHNPLFSIFSLFTCHTHHNIQCTFMSTVDPLWVFLMLLLA